MKKYLKEIIIFILQIMLFYIMPLFMNADTVIIIILFMLLGTFALTLILGIVSESKIKFYYPLIVPIIFAPSLLFFYNETAYIFGLFYMIDSLFGIIIGDIIYKIKKRAN